MLLAGWAFMTVCPVFKRVCSVHNAFVMENIVYTGGACFLFQAVGLCMLDEERPSLKKNA